MNTEITYTETKYLYEKFSNEQYKPSTKWVTSNTFVPDPILTSKQYIDSTIPQDNVDINIDE